MNFKPTWYQSNCPPSLIDHYFTNKPQHVDSVETIKSIISDHCIVKAQFHVNCIRAKPQFGRNQDTSQLNSENLMSKIEESDVLEKIFQKTDPDEIAEYIVLELNRIIEELAPSRIVQVKHNFEPWENEETREVLREANEQLSIAIQYNRVEEWRLFRYLRNKARKTLEKAKNSYFVKRLTHVKNVWQEFKKFKGT